MSGLPSNIILPYIGVDFDSSKAQTGTTGVPVQLLLIGQKLAAGTLPEAQLQRVFDSDEVGIFAGVGSDLHAQAIKSFAENSNIPTYIVALDDADTSSAATQPLPWDGIATENGEVSLYINGGDNRYTVGVLVGDTAEEISALMIAEMADDPDIQVTGAFLTDVFTLTHNNKGVAVGDMDVRFNLNVGEKIPAGLTFSVGTYAAGTVDPDIQDAIDVIGNTWFQVICAPYNDATNLTAMEVYLTAQNANTVQRDGVYYFCRKDTKAGQITFSTNTDRNSQFMCMLDGQNRPNSNSQQIAAIAASVGVSVADNPAIPLHRIPVTSLTPIPEEDIYEFLDRNQMALNGIMTLTDDNGVQTEGMVTMYLKNSAGAADTAYQQQNSVFQLQRLRYTFVQWIATRYPRSLLANNIDRLEAGTQVLTPTVGKNEAVSWFIQEAKIGIVQNVDSFKKETLCTIDSSNKNRLNWLLSNELMRQFIVGSGTNQFS